MTPILNELIKYLIKFVAMIICAGLGIMVGKNIRKNKDAKNQEEI